MFKRLFLILSISLLTLAWNREPIVQLKEHSKDKLEFSVGADAESFAVFPTDYSGYFCNTSDGKQFSKVLEDLGKPVLRLASMQRWDWRGKSQTEALVNWKKKEGPLGYPYFTADQYYRYVKSRGIGTIPMLDVRYFYDEQENRVRPAVEAPARASEQMAAGYASFLKTQKYSPLFWEIGNEEYAEENGMSPEAFTLVAKSYIDAVRHVDPSARFGIPICTWRPSWKKWSEAVLDELGSHRKFIHFAVVHYYHPDAFSDRPSQEVIDILDAHGYHHTKIAITEWRHTYLPSDEDQLFKSAARYSRFLLFMRRFPRIEVACVHAFPMFGGLAEWSNGNFWTSYRPGNPNRQRDSLRIPRWRLLPFGAAQRLLQKSLHDRLIAYQEEPGGLSLYLFQGKRGVSLIVTNEREQPTTKLVRLSFPVQKAEGQVLSCPDPLARPQDNTSQPWEVKKVVFKGNGNQLPLTLGGGSVMALSLEAVAQQQQHK